MEFRLNPERFNCFSNFEIAEKIEEHIRKSIKKFFWSNVFKTKLQALLEEIEGYFARNKEYHPDICDFNKYVQHWTEAHRGVIPDLYLDAIESQFGKLEGPLYVVRGHCSWDAREDHRNDPIPIRENNE